MAETGSWFISILKVSTFYVGRHDTQHKHAKNNDTQHKDIQHYNI